jgi:hypothetical protein
LRANPHLSRAFAAANLGVIGTNALAAVATELAM